jgi:hypothetical protein
VLTTRVQGSEACVMWVRLQAIGEPAEKNSAKVPVKTGK